MKHIRVDWSALADSGRDALTVARGSRAVLACGMAVAILIAAAVPADAGSRPEIPVHKRAAQAKKEPPPKPLNVPIIAISIGSQRLTVFENGVPVAHVPVSTGTRGHPTPTGIFSIIQKRKIHYSNLYGAAPMPYMQRITWSGVALHAGILPGYPASHGCIRMPRDFAVKLWSMTRTGARVIVARNDITPVEFAHARLFVLKKKPVDATPVAAMPPSAKPANLAGEFEIQPSAMLNGALRSDTAKAIEPVTSSNTADVIKTAEAAMAATDAIPAAAVSTFAGASAGTATATEAPKPVDAPVAREPKSVEASSPERPLRSGPVSVFVSKKEGKLFVRKGFEPLFAVPVTIARPDLPLGTHVFTATEFKKDGTTLRWFAVSMPGEAPKTIERRSNVENRKSGKVSANRMAKEPAVLPPPQTAAEALERIDIPAEALDRISALVSPGASLIISDQGLGDETGKETDFIVLSR